MLADLNEEIDATKMGLRNKNLDNWHLKVPRVNIQDINYFGIVHLTFTSDMHPHLKNKTGDADEKTRRLDQFEDPLSVI